MAAILVTVLPLLRSYRDEVGYSSSCYSMVASSPCARDASRSWLLAVWQPSWLVLPLLRSYRDEVGYSSSCYSMVASSPCARDASRSWLLAVWQPSWLLSYPYCGPTGMRWAIPAAATVWWHPALVPGTHLGPGCGQYGSHLGYCLTLTAVLQGWGGLFQQLLQYGGIQPLCQGRI